ncbi:MAG: hypothetical protein O3C69_03625 [Chloroflexi bacterium]|nr:hypothetical protein [Chloroflexota bacterium]
MGKTIKRVSIKKETLDDILAGVTNNPLAEMEIPRVLADIIRKGGLVTVQDDVAGKTYRLEIKSGKFILRD